MHVSQRQTHTRVITPEHSSFSVCSMSTSLQHPSKPRRLLGRPKRIRFAFSPEHHIAPRPGSPFVFSFRYVRQLTMNGRIRWNHHHRASSAPDQASSCWSSSGVNSSNAIHSINICFPRLCIIILMYTGYKALYFILV